MTEPSGTFDLVWVAGVVGFFLPLLISLVKKSTWSVQVKRVVALAASVISGVVAVGVQLGWTFTDPTGFLQNALLSVTQIYVVAGVTYQNFWKDTAIERTLEGANSIKDTGPTSSDPGYKTGQ